MIIIVDESDIWIILVLLIIKEFVGEKVYGLSCILSVWIFLFVVVLFKLYEGYFWVMFSVKVEFILCWVFWVVDVLSGIGIFGDIVVWVWLFGVIEIIV